MRLVVNWNLCSLILIMVIAGYFGGLVNYYLVDENGEKGKRSKSIILGLGASFLVPLFLNMISSKLLDKTTLEEPNNLLVFMGFCLIAAMSSKSFIENITDRMMNDLEDTKKKIKEVKAVTDPIANKEMEQYSTEESNKEFELLKSGASKEAIKISGSPDFKADDNEIVTLIALKNGKFTYRTISSLSKDISDIKGVKVDLKETLSLLIKLEAFDLVGRRLSENNHLRFYLCDKGKKKLISMDLK